MIFHFLINFCFARNDRGLKKKKKKKKISNSNEIKVTPNFDPIVIDSNDYNSNDPPLINFLVLFWRNDWRRKRRRKKEISNSYNFVLAGKNEVKVIPSNFDLIFIYLNDYNSNDPPLINFCFARNDWAEVRRKKISNSYNFVLARKNDILILYLLI